MSTKILKEYLDNCKAVDTVGTPLGFYHYIELNYPDLLRKMNRDVILKMFGGMKEHE